MRFACLYRGHPRLGRMGDPILLPAAVRGKQFEWETSKPRLHAASSVRLWGFHCEGLGFWASPPRDKGGVLVFGACRRDTSHLIGGVKTPDSSLVAFPHTALTRMVL